MAGNIIAATDDNQCDYDIFSLSCLAAANFAAVDTMAKIVGEEEFSLLFHKGKREHIHFSKVKNELLMITIFDKRITLGLVRFKVAEVIQKITDIWDQ